VLLNHKDPSKTLFEDRFYRNHLYSSLRRRSRTRTDQLMKNTRIYVVPRHKIQKVNETCVVEPQRSFKNAVRGSYYLYSSLRRRSRSRTDQLMKNPRIYAVPRHKIQKVNETCVAEPQRGLNFEWCS
jgi:hypothetical protein